MVRILQILGVLTLIAAGVVFLLCLVQSSQEEAESPVLSGASAIERFKQGGEYGGLPLTNAPLIEQATILAAYLNPPQAPNKDTVSRPRVARQSATRFTPAVGPATSVPKFRLHGTSYYPSQPERSMALIWVVDGQEGKRRWVKEGTQVGHFVIREIRPSSVIYSNRSGDPVREMAVEHGPARQSIVKRNTGLAQASPSSAPVWAGSDANTISDGIP